MGEKKKTSCFYRCIAIACFVLAVAAPAAQAGPKDPFTPELSVETSNTQAGAHPDLTIAMQKAVRNHCVAPDPPYSSSNHCTELYYEQNLKDMTVHLPPGLVPDANAAPYCDAFQKPDPLGLQEIWDCLDEEAAIGVVDITSQLCDEILTPSDPSECYSLGAPLPDYPYPNDGYEYYFRAPGIVYNERPRTSGPFAGEQGHLVVLWPKLSVDDEVSTTASRSDISVRVRRSDTGIDSVTTNIPDFIPGIFGPVVGQPVDIVLTLKGNRGYEKGNPLLTNPTSCSFQKVDAEFRGWENNSRATGPFNPMWVAGSGDGKDASDTVPYQVTGCDSVPYDPGLTISLDNLGPEGVPAITSTVTQAPLGEATTEEVEVHFPRNFKVNDKNTATHCPDGLLKASEEGSEDRCPDSSKIGEVVAESRLLPEGQKLEGNVYLAGLTGDSIKVSTFIRGKADPDKGFIDFDIRMDAEGKVGDDLVLKTTFSNLPQTPISRFDLNLFGGEKGLIKNPRVCNSKPERIVADFKSHSGKVKQNTVPVEIRGCSDPQLDVELSNRRKGELTDLDLSVSSKGTAIGAVELRMARQLRWGYRKRLSPRVAKHVRGKRIKRLKSAGTATFTTTSGERKVRFKAKRTKRGNLGFKPLARKTREGNVIAAQVPAFSASLFRTARRQPRILTQKRKKGKRGRRARRRQQSDLVLTGLPGGNLTAVDLSLRGKDKRRKFFLRNPNGCKRLLNFVAIVTTTDGRKLALKDQVRLRGKGCAQKK